MTHGRLAPIPDGYECILHVTFFLCPDNRVTPDVDNLLKPFLDPLKKQYGSSQKPKGGAGLIGDDRNFLGIWAKREIAEIEKVAFVYYLTRSFYIESVSVRQVQKEWRFPMQVITAFSLSAEGAQVGPYTFIDNQHGHVFRGELSDMHGAATVPGYDWINHQGEVVAGCMTFCRRPSASNTDEKFWWLNKWS